ncbi:MAG: hypothetical protein WDM71_08720 [Ferruginibacter sp.]
MGKIFWQKARRHSRCSSFWRSRISFGSKKRSILGIGFNNIVYVYDANTKQATNGVIPVPIDLNNNGKIDADESFYGTTEQITTAIANGKYPAPPARDLYL